MSCCSNLILLKLHYRLLLQWSYEESETLEHLLYHCEKVNTFWNEIITILKSQDLVSTNFDIKNIIFGHFCSDDDDSVLVNYIILERKYLIFRSKLSTEITFLATSLFAKWKKKTYQKSNVSLRIKITKSTSTIKIITINNPQ